jgi:hypothetical protein
MNREGSLTAAEGDEPASYAELTRLYDVDFVAAAYPIMLGRAADPVGLAYYVDRLRSGRARISVLDQLSRSSEVREDWQSFPGIHDAILKYRRSLRPSGWKLALSDPELGRTAAIRRARALQNAMGSHRQQLQQSLTKLSAQQEAIKYLVSNLEMRKDTTESRSAGRLDSFGRIEIPLPELRSRHIDEVRSIDLAPAARAVIDALRF